MRCHEAVNSHSLARAAKRANERLELSRTRILCGTADLLACGFVEIRRFSFIYERCSPLCAEDQSTNLQALPIMPSNGS
jgi:hypothetical protein